MEGVVEIFRPNFIEIKETPRNFFKFLKKIKEKDRESKRYKRIRNKNSKILTMIEEQINNESKVYNG